MCPLLTLALIAKFHPMKVTQQWTILQAFVV